MRRLTHDPARLSFLIENKIRLAVHCNNHGCLTRSILDVEPLVERLGADYPIPLVAKHMKCAACGSQDCSVNPNWNDEDVPGRPKGFVYSVQMLGE